MSNAAFFKLEAFNFNVSFYRRTLTTVIVILRLKSELKCYCQSKSKEIGHPRPIKTAE